MPRKDDDASLWQPLVKVNDAIFEPGDSVLIRELSYKNSDIFSKSDDDDVSDLKLEINLKDHSL